jgi:hypothetical protein
MTIQPADGILVSLDTYGDTVVPRAGLPFRFACIAVRMSVCFAGEMLCVISLVPSNISTPNHQDVALLQCRSLPLERLFNFHDRNLVP